MKFQNVTSKQQIMDFIKNEHITIKQREGGSTFTGAAEWYIKDGHWGHEYVITQDKQMPNRYMLSAMCSDAYDIPFQIVFTTEAKPKSVVEVEYGKKGLRSRTYRTDSGLKWTKAIVLLVSAIIQHGYCN